MKGSIRHREGGMEAAREGWRHPGRDGRHRVSCSGRQCHLAARRHPQYDARKLPQPRGQQVLGAVLGGGMGWGSSLATVMEAQRPLSIIQISPDIRADTFTEPRSPNLLMDQMQRFSSVIGRTNLIGVRFSCVAPTEPGAGFSAGPAYGHHAGIPETLPPA